jgi:hypothetical protein
MRPPIAYLAIALLAILALSAASPAAEQDQSLAEPQYDVAQLDQLLAPVALYPDALLGQILMASTHPLEVVEAARWVQDPANAALKGDALSSALETLDWDPSVKALVPFPSVLQMMDSRLDWMKQLGDAFLAQQADVMDAVQRLRRQAQSAGTLTSTPQQTVVTQGGTIVIVPASPDVVYVPVYDPFVVYGAWPYPAYPPYFFPPPPSYYYGPAVAGIGFGVGFVIVQSFWGWHHFDWQHHRIDVDRHRFNAINRHAIDHFHRPPFASHERMHNPQHRLGGPHRSPQLHERFEHKPPGSPQHRGHEPVPPAVRTPPAQPPIGRTEPRTLHRSAPRANERSASIHQRSHSGIEARQHANRGREGRQSMHAAPAHSTPGRGGGGRGDGSPGR